MMRVDLRILHVFGAVLAFAGAPASAAPSVNDYARGALIEPSSEAPLIEATLPDELYQTVTRADLRDVRVFNAEGAPVAHAFCAPVAPPELVISEHDVPVYELQEALRAQSTGDRVEVQTSTGTQINVEGASHRGDASGGHILDVRALELDVRAVQFDWTSPDNASEVRVRIEASDDLDRWEVVVPSTRLLRASGAGRELRRDRIEAPRRRYEYLRIERVDGGPALQLASATAEAVSPGAPNEPLWFTPNVLPSEDPNIFLLDGARAAPVRFARVRPQQENASFRASIESRPDEKSAWRERWNGEVYLIVKGTERRESAPARFEPVADRYWRVLLPKDAASAAALSIELGYEPLRVRFLAQGSAPYTLAFGSRRAELAEPAACDALLNDVSAEERRALTAEGYVTNYKALAGDAAFKPLPKKTPVRVIVLWSVLVIGVGLLVAMALSLLKRLRPESN